MNWKNYIILCVVLTVVWVGGLLFIQPFSDLVESLMLLFLSTNAR
jgi:hypothetical protein